MIHAPETRVKRRSYFSNRSFLFRLLRWISTVFVVDPYLFVHLFIYLILMVKDRFDRVVRVIRLATPVFTKSVEDI